MSKAKFATLNLNSHPEDEVIICPNCGGCMGVGHIKDDRINNLSKTLESTRQLLVRIAEVVRKSEFKKLIEDADETT